MPGQNRPVLSIGIIFKNEIRCLERCVKSFEPLRKAVPCELVMADTGSDDGSREIAERYADVFFDFPWINDFSAARNAVIERCSGEWFLTVDADEWMDEDCSELAAFLRSGKKLAGSNLCTVVVRNYADKELSWRYIDFMAIRLMRMSSGLRYVNAIHEMWNAGEKDRHLHSFCKTILHHDGYVCMNDGSSAGEEKRRRNMELLKEHLKENPDDLLTLLQCIESSADAKEQMTYILRGLEGIRERRSSWNRIGPPILRHAVHAACTEDMPEAQEWIDLADNLFPESVYTTVDVQIYASQRAWRKLDFPEVIRRSENYFRGARDYREGRFHPEDLLYSTISGGPPHHETSIRALTARAYLYDGQPEKALETLQTLDYPTMDADQVSNLLLSMAVLHSRSTVDTAPLIREFWENISAPVPSEEAAEKRKQQFLKISAEQFTPGCREIETAHMGEFENVEMPAEGEIRPRLHEQDVLDKLPVFRYSYTLFRPLQGQHEMGDAAVILDTEAPEEMLRIMEGMKNPCDLPVYAMNHALLHGVPFPLKDKPMSLEEMDTLNGRMLQEKDVPARLAVLAAERDFGENPQSLLWARGLALAGVRGCEWKDEAEGLALCRAFVRIEKTLLPWYYTAELLQEENVCLLPPMHRFGWYCVQAFDALDGGDAAGYARHLREGLRSCESMKNMVEFLLENTPELQIPEPKPSGELMELAGKVRGMLAAYAPDDPAVAAIKGSPVYQKVARLIEGPELMLVGGLKQ